jgi:hypothetical protein
MKLSNICPNCGRYIFKYGDELDTVGKPKFLYPVKRVYSTLWKKIYGKYPLGKFFKARCPVCGKRLAIFCDLTEELKSYGPVALYLCTLSDRPFDAEKCANSENCKQCGVIKQLREGESSLWYKKTQNDLAQMK